MPISRGLLSGLAVGEETRRRDACSLLGRESWTCAEVVGWRQSPSRLPTAIAPVASWRNLGQESATSEDPLFWVQSRRGSSS